MFDTHATAKLLQRLVILVLAMSQFGCASIRTGSHYDETANFAAFKTFSWASETPYVTDGESIRISPLSQKNIQTAIRRQLESAGYDYVDAPGTGDMLIAYTVGTRDKIRVESYPVQYWHGWAEKTIRDSDREDPKSAIDEGVAQLFADFPQ